VILQKQKLVMKNTNKNKQNLHMPVLLEEVLECLSPKPGESYLDLTAGYGGHAEVVIKKTAAANQATLIDRDEQAIDYLRSQNWSVDTETVRADFLSGAENLLSSGRQYDMILADLGVSSPHLNMASRGFAFRLDGPLDMRMDQSQELTAEIVVNSYEETELARLVARYGEEPKARRVARLIVENRPIKSTGHLAEVVSKAWPSYSRHHPAIRTFQAIRIEVNDELGQVESVLPICLELLKPGGRLAVISFHSLEDRVVKQFLKNYGGNRYDADLRILTKSPIVASPEEMFTNPRARSAKLRAAVKIKNKKKGEL
jgi:16S rRNA (cytosine1402-N4)-methyltransferase